MKIENYYKKRKRFYDYVAGFVDGEASFTISIKKEPTTKYGFAIDPEFKVSQLKEKAQVLEFIKQAIGCGKIFDKPGQKNMKILVVRNRRQLAEKVIPFFNKHKLIVKEQEFKKFSSIVKQLEQKKQATEKGFLSIVKQATSDMKNRKYSYEFVKKNMKRPSETIR